MKCTDNLKKWNIVLVSTAKYLEPARQEIMSLFEKEYPNVQCLAFEKGFSEDKTKNSYELCYKRIFNDPIDIVLLFIDEYYGNLDGDISVTRREYECCIKNNKFVLKFIKKSVADDYDKYLKNPKYLPSKKKKYDNFVKTMEFVASIKNQPNSDMLNYYTNNKDLPQRVIELLKLNTRHFLWDYLIDINLPKQINSIEQINKGIKIGEIFNEVYIDSDCEMFGDSKSKIKKASGIIEIIQKNKCLISGDGGTGKTTILSKLFFEQKALYENESSHLLPLFVSMNGFKIKDLKLFRILEMYFNRLLNKYMYPFYSADNVEFMLLIDGFDEILGVKDNTQLKKCFESNSLSSHLVLSCRENYTKGQTLSKYFDILIRIIGFKEDSTIENVVEKYIKYFEKRQENCLLSSKRDQILKIVRGSASTVFHNPFMLYLFLNYIKDHENFEFNWRPSIILKNCVDSIFVREAQEIDLSEEQINKLYWYLGSLSWILYINRLENKPTLEYKKVLNSLFDGKVVEIYKRIIDLFIVISDNNKYIISMTNEKLMDFFCGNYLYQSITLKDYKISSEIPVDYFYYTNFKIDIVHRCKELMTENDKAIAFDFLVKKYNEFIIKELGAKEKIMNWIVNLIVRTEQYNKLIEFVIQEKQKKEQGNKNYINTYYLEHVLVQLGIVPFEYDFMNKMEENAEFDSYVRGCYLSYYDDTLYNKISGFIDDGTRSWERCFKAFQQHINEPKAKDGTNRNNVRRLEFRLARRFIEVRETQDLTDSIAEFYLNLPEDKYYVEMQHEEEYFRQCHRRYKELCKAEYMALCEAIRNKRKFID